MLVGRKVCGRAEGKWSWTCGQRLEKDHPILLSFWNRMPVFLHLWTSIHFPLRSFVPVTFAYGKERLADDETKDTNRFIASLSTLQELHHLVSSPLFLFGVFFLPDKIMLGLSSEGKKIHHQTKGWRVQRKWWPDHCFQAYFLPREAVIKVGHQTFLWHRQWSIILGYRRFSVKSLLVYIQ